MRICASLSFKGNCREAMGFYADVFQAKPQFITYASMPPCEEMPISEAQKDLILHGELHIDREQSFMFCDDLRDVDLIANESVSICLLFEQLEEIDRIFNRLAVGGAVLMPLAETFWSKSFGMLRDRFGFTWSLNLCQMPDSAQGNCACQSAPDSCEGCGTKSSSSFSAVLVERPALHLAGLHIATDMDKASNDAPRLWQQFTSRMSEIAGNLSHGLFGVSRMTSARDFDYWAAVVWPKDQALPAGFAIFDLPASRYITVEVEDLSQMSAAYNFAYQIWPASPSGQAVNMAAPCFEWYKPHWQMGDAFTLFVPLQ